MNGCDDDEIVDIIPITKITFNKDIETQTNKYHNLECCDSTRGVDSLLEEYKKDRETLLNYMINDPDTLMETLWKQNSPLAIDNDCRCQMGKGDIRSPFACAQCRNIRRLTDFRLGGIERPFTVECGNMSGKELIVSDYDIYGTFLIKDEDATKRAKRYLQQYQSLKTCGTPDSLTQQCITGDSFTIRTLMLILISKIFSDNAIPNFLHIHTAFICRGIGYTLFDAPDIGGIEKLKINDKYIDIDKETPQLKSSIVRSIITQLLVILLELTKINFSHGTPSIHALVFSSDPVSYKYDDYHVKGPLTVMLSDMWNSSATVNGTHYFPKNVKTNMYLDNKFFIPEITTKKVSMAHCYDVGATDENMPIVCPANITTCPDKTTYDVCKARNTTFFRLSNTNVEIYNAVRHIGFPLYIGAFDFYCIMVSLMCDRHIYDCVLRDDTLYRLWSMMWLPEDLQPLEARLREYHLTDFDHNRQMSNRVLTLIRGRKSVV